MEPDIDDIDIDSPLDDVHPEDHDAQLGARALFVKTVRRPSEAMRNLAAHPGRRWLLPLLALVVLSVAAAVASLPSKQRYDRALSRIQIERMRETDPQTAEVAAQFMGDEEGGGAFAGLSAGTAILGAILGPLVGALAGAAVLHFMGTILGGQQTYGQMLSATAWGRLPLVFQAGLRLVNGLMGGYDPYSDGLAGLVAPDPTQPYASPSALGPILAQISLWHLWALALFVVAVRVVCHVSLRKALTAVVIYVALIILLGEAGVGLGKFGARLGANMAQID